MHVACAGFALAVWQGTYNARGYTRAEWKAAGHGADTFRTGPPPGFEVVAVGRDKFRSPYDGRLVDRRKGHGTCTPKAAKALVLYDRMTKPGPITEAWRCDRADLDYLLKTMDETDTACYYAGVQRRVQRTKA